uniref:CCHC-type domain-containing protein n=1 Tax=Xenopus tropicalis TaxID=8364 RepID=A0A803KCZ6_XENTR
EMQPRAPSDTLSQQLAALTQAVRDLQGGYQQLQAQIQGFGATSNPVSVSPPMAAGAAAAHPPVLEPKMPLPERFSGDRKKFCAFLNDCRLLFLLKPQMYASEQTKVGVAISLLSGEPKTWAHRLLEVQSPLLSDSNAFFGAMGQLYDDPKRSSTAEAMITSLQQGRQRIRRRQHNLCLYCGLPGHFLRDCPTRPASKPSSSFFSTPTISKDI